VVARITQGVGKESEKFMVEKTSENREGRGEAGGCLTSTNSQLHRPP